MPKRRLQCNHVAQKKQDYFKIYGQEVKKVLNEVKKLYSEKLLNRLYYFYNIKFHRGDGKHDGI